MLDVGCWMFNWAVCRAAMPSGSMWTSTSRTDGNFGAHLVLHFVADAVRSFARSSAGPPRRACPRKTGSPSCGRGIFPRRATPGMVPATARICSISLRSGARSINSLNAGRSSRQPFQAMTHAASERRPVVRRLVAFAADERNADADERRRRGDGVAAMMPRVGFHGGAGHRLRLAQHEAEQRFLHRDDDDENDQRPRRRRDARFDDSVAANDTQSTRPPAAACRKRSRRRAARPCRGRRDGPRPAASRPRRGRARR